jgi:hypothetical protein
MYYSWFQRKIKGALAMDLKRLGFLLRAVASVALLVAFAFFTSLQAQTTVGSLPRIVQKDGRHALFVDDAP